MKRFQLLLLGTSLLTGTSLSAQRATMEAPIIRGTTDEITVTAQFRDFDPESQYRIGVGATQSVQGLKVELLRNDAPLTREVTSFTQGHTSHWWPQVNSLISAGFAFNAGELQPGATYTLRISIPREQARQLDHLFVFASKNYGGNLWYLEDGVEITAAHFGRRR